jgi:CHAT domain-containing protein/tetratricopeptide (TPR) repeat protein
LTAEQKEQLKVRDRLKAEVDKLRKEEKWAEAVAACERQLAIERQVWGDWHDDVVAALNQLAGLHEEREDWPAAKKRREEVLRIQTKRFGEKDWRVGDARRAVEDGQRLARMTVAEGRDLKIASNLSKLMMQLNGQGKYAEAAEACRKRLAIYQKVLGADHATTASGMNDLGYLLKKQGQYADARTYYAQALAIRKKALEPEHPDTAFVLHDLGSLLAQQGDYSAARPYFEQALAIRDKTLGPDHPLTAVSLNTLGTLLSFQGDHAGARPHLEKALAIRQKVLGPDHPHTARSLNNLAGALQSQGDYTAARPLYEQALAIYRKVLSAEHPATAETLNNLGTLLTHEGNYLAARPYFEQALAMWKKVYGIEQPDTATCMSNLGTILSFQEDYAGARLYHEQALAIRRKVLGAEHPATAESLNNLGLLLHSQGDYSGARSYYQEALKLFKLVLGVEHSDTAQVMNNLGALFQSQGHHVEARAYYDQALATTRKLLDVSAAGQSERQQRAMAKNFRKYLDCYLSVASSTGVPPVVAYHVHLLWKGAVLTRRIRRVGSDQNLQLADRFGEYESVCGRLAHLSTLKPYGSQRDEWQKNLESLTLQKEKLEIELAPRSEDIKRRTGMRQFTPGQLQQSLPQGTAVVDFLEYSHNLPPPENEGRMKLERRLLAVVVRPDRAFVRVDLGPSAPVSAAVEAWRKTDCSDRTAGAELRKLIWQPLEVHIADATTILISPDGVLARIPFAALPGKDSGKYLAEEHVIAVIPVPQLLPEMFDPRPESAQSLLVVGDVQFDAAGETTEVAANVGGEKNDVPATIRSAPRGGTIEEMLQGMRPLPGTKDEAAAIKGMFGRRFPEARATELVRSNATEGAFRTFAPKHRFLHLATHGYFTPKETTAVQQKAEERMAGMFQHQDVTGWHPGLLSGLVLAGAKQKPDPMRDDGILTALEVAALDLSNVELAVLSACETGLGEVAGGEGILGLQRAFQTAGARSVVSSMWKVPDRATQMLMTKFYENLWDKKMPKLEALRQAQIWMLREVPKDKKLRQEVQRGLGDTKAAPEAIGDGPLPPYYWAGFVLSGDWR